jgi:type I restriction enzyme S subunit
VTYPSYPSYKPSGVDWLGDLPEHWEKRAIKWESSVLRGASPRPIDDPRFFDEEGEYAWVRISDVTAAGMYLSETEQRLSTLGSSLSVKLQPGALFLSIAATVGKPAITNIKCCIHDGFVYFPRFKGDPRFLFYVFASGEPYKGLGKLGTQLNLNTDTVGSIIAGFPQMSEQCAIANFLDAETAKLDKLVAKKRELIEKLKEKRAALISRTVTRGLPSEAARAAGLDANPKLKPSDIEWFGEIPEHWGCAQLRRFICLITSGSRGWAEHYADEGAIFVRIGNLTRDSISIDLSDVQYVDPPAGAEGERTKIQSGDILFSITAYLGSVAVATEAVVGGYINQHIALVRLTGSVLIPRFLGYAALADLGQQQLNGQAYGGTKVQLALDDVKSLWLPIPPPPEQRAIADYLDAETANIDRMMAKVEEAIERLQEYRTALITAAVTGKIDVRGYVRATEAA